MRAKQLYFVLLTVFVLLLAGFAGVGYETDTFLSKRADKLSKLRADSEVLSTLQDTLAKNKQDIAKYSELNQIAETVVPQDKDQAEAVQEIVNLASASGISKLSSITFPSSTLGTTATGSSKNPNLTQLTPVKGISGVYNLQITVTQDSGAGTTYDQFLTFLSKLEQNRRTAQVTGISIQPTAGSNTVAFTLILNEYIKP